jgi:uncharacterized protein YpuA (DUF1002 family)
MIKKGSVNMSDIKMEATLEELKEQYKTVAEECIALSQQIKQKEKEEADKLKEELSEIQGERTKEIETKQQELNDLIKSYIRDYGEFHTYRNVNSISDITNYLFKL